MSSDNCLSEIANEKPGICSIKKLKTMCKTFDNYYNHEKYIEYVPASVVMFLLSNFMLFSDMFLISGGVFKNLPDTILIGYCVVYYNINSWLGRSMTKFLLLLRLVAVALSYVLPYYKIISLSSYIVSLLFLTVGYNKLTERSYEELVKLRYHNLYLGPFYAYNYYEKNYNLEENIHKIIDMCIIYIKKFSTSDVIKQYSSVSETKNEDCKETLQEIKTDIIKEISNENEKEESNTEDIVENILVDEQLDEVSGMQTRSKVNKKDT